MWEFIRSFFRGLTTLKIKEIAVNNPEAVAEGGIQDMKRDREKLVAATSVVIADRNQLQMQYDAVSADLAKVEIELRGAIAKKLMDVGPMLTAKKANLVSTRTDIERKLAKSKEDSEKLKRDLKRYEADIQVKTQEVRADIARLRSNQARQRLEEMLSGLSVRRDIQAFSAIHEAANQAEAKIDLQRELRSGNLDDQIEQAREAGAKAAGEDEFARLIAEQEAKAGGVAATAATGTSDDGKAV